MSTIGPLRDPATCLHSVHSDDHRYGKDRNKRTVIRGKCMWCDLEIRAPLGKGFGRGYEYAEDDRLRREVVDGRR